MKLRPLLSLLSATNHRHSATPQPSKLLISDSTTHIPHPTTAAATATTSSSYNHETLTLTVSHLHLPASQLNLLTIHNHLLYAATGNLIHVIDTTSFSLLHTLTVAGASSGSVKSVAFSNGKIYTAHQDNRIRVSKLTKTKAHKRIATLPTFEDRLLRSILPRNYVNVRRHRKKLWIEHYDAVSGLAFVTDELICSISLDKYLKIWRKSDLRCVESIKAHDDAINAVVVAADGTIFTGSADRRIKLWAVNDDASCKKYMLIATLEKHKSGVNALALNDDGSLLFSGGGDREVLVWDAEQVSNGVVLCEVLRGHSTAVLCLISVGKLLFSGSGDRTVRIWRRGCLGKFYCVKVLDGYENPVRSLVADDCKSHIRVFSEIHNGVIRLITIGCR